MLSEPELELIYPTKHLVTSLYKLDRKDVLNFLLKGCLTVDVDLKLEATVYLLGIMSVAGTTEAGFHSYRDAVLRVEGIVPGFINNTLCSSGGTLGVRFSEHSFAAIEARILANRQAGDLAWANGKREKGSYYHQDARDLQARLDGTKSEVVPENVERLHEFFLLGVDYSKTLQLPLRGLSK